MAQFYTLPTAIGEAKIANALALGGTITISDLAIGDGGGSLPTPDSGRTTLVNQVRRAPINTSEVDPDNPNWIVVEQVLPPDVGGWTIREIGLFDADGDMIAYGNYPETYKPVLSEGSGRTQTIRFVMQVSDTAAVTLKVDPSVVLATRKYVDSELDAHEEGRNHPDATTTDKGFVRKATSAEAKARASTIPAVTPAGLGAALADHEQAETAHTDNQIGISTEIPQAKGATDVADALAALGGFAGDGFQNLAVFDAVGIAEWSVPQILQDGLRKAHVTVIGGGGGGGRHDRGGGGGGGAGRAEKIIDLSGISSVTVTVGDGGYGAPEGIGNAVGSNGGTTSFGNYVSATGGGGGQNWLGGSCGEGVGGDFNTGLGVGESSARIDATTSPQYRGGSGGGPGGRTAGSAAQGSKGDDAVSPGGGGAGGNTNAPGGRGRRGIVIVRW